MKTLEDKVVIEKIDKSLNQMDALRLSGLNDFDNIQALKNEISMRESKRLTEKYGKNHPKVIELNARNANYSNMTVGLASEIEKASMKNEPFDANLWRLRGKVFDEKLMPMEGLTVYFSDLKKQWIEQLGSYCTDKTGYFSLTISAELLDKMEVVAIFTTVSDKNKMVLCIAEMPATVKKGKIDYVEIMIKDGGCVEPPSRGDAKPTDPTQDNPNTKPNNHVAGPLNPNTPDKSKKEDTKPVK